MDFRSMLIESVQACGKNAKNPFFLYSLLCDKAGNAFVQKNDVEEFYSLDKEFYIVKEIMENTEPKTIGKLLEKCRAKSAVSHKECLKWIYALFEFYYQEKHQSNANTEEVLKGLEADWPTLEIAELDSFKPKQETKEDKKKKSEEPSVQNAFPTANPLPPPPAPQQKVKKPAPQVPVLPQPQAVTTPPKPKKKPKNNRLYITRDTPDDAWVYIHGITYHHVLQCPMLNPYASRSPMLIIKKRLYKDVKNGNVCRCGLCGNFTPDTPDFDPKWVFI